MKSANTIARIAIALSLIALASASFAATNPLANPYGLAVDAKGNLWVANTDGGASETGNILVFSPSYALQKDLTIIANLSYPTAVAFDPLGNLWVANSSPSNGGTYGSVAEYINGVQNTAATITNGVNEPFAMAIDGIGDIWLVNQQNNITVYESTAYYAPPATLVQTITPAGGVRGIAIGGAGNVLLFGGGSYTFLTPLAPTLATGAVENNYYTGLDGVALGSDNKGNTYIGNSDDTLYLANPTGDAHIVAYLGFVPTGIAVDNVRGRVYVSDGPQNMILVYNTEGTFLHKIE